MYKAFSPDPAQASKITLVVSSIYDHGVTSERLRDLLADDTESTTTTTVMTTVVVRTA